MADYASVIGALRDVVPKLIANSQVPGLNIALADRDDIIFSAGFGTADVASDAIMGPDTVMRMGSMSKPVTATAVMQLVEQGILGLDDPVQPHLPFEVRNPLGGGEITLRHLLTHTAGLTDDAGFARLRPTEALSEFLAASYKRDATEYYGGSFSSLWRSRVGERWEYSNRGTATLGYLVELLNRDGLDFSAYVQRHIFNPLAMSSTELPADGIRAELAGRLSSGYAQFGPILIPTPELFITEYPAGALVSTPSDYARFLQAFLNEGAFNGQRILRPETVREMLRPQTKGGAGVGRDTGLVWSVSEQEFGHPGGYPFGWRSDAQAFRGIGLVVVAATNVWPRIITHMLPAAVTALVRERVGILSEEVPASTTAAEAGPAVPAWELSYAVGLLFIDGFFQFGETAPLSGELLTRIVGGAQVAVEGDLWDPEGFLAAVRDLSVVDGTVDSIRAFIASEHNRIGADGVARASAALDALAPAAVPLEPPSI